MAIIKYEGSTYHTAGELPPVGSRAPDLSLVSTKLQNVTLTNWTGMRKLFNIFVSIDTEVCAKSVIEFDRLAAKLDDVAMLMVSCDLPFAHVRFGKEHDLTKVIGLSAIRNAGFGKNYGVGITEGPLKGMFARAVIVLDENSTVVYHEHIEDIATEPNYEAAMRALGVRAEAD